MVIGRVGFREGDNVRIRHLILDVLKPHYPGIVELSKALAGVDGVDRVTIDIVEMDQDTESVKIEIEGNNINVEKLIKRIKEMGASVHSIDSVTTEISKV